MLENKCQLLFTTNFCIEQLHKINMFSPIYGSFCRNCKYFHVWFDFIQQILPFCELMLKPLQFHAKRRKGSSSWCLAKRGICAQRMTSVKQDTQLAQRVGKPQKRSVRDVLAQHATTRPSSRLSLLALSSLSQISLTRAQRANLAKRAFRI